MNDLLDRDIVARIVGVIDLLDGTAVHAIAGDRDRYLAIEFCGGDPIALVDHYRDLGVTAIYVADLDSIQHGRLQFSTIESICRAACPRETVLDIGWTGHETQAARDAIANLAETYSGTLWVAATESCRSPDALNQLAELVTPQRVLLGIDYRDGCFIACDADEDQWVRKAIESGCHGAVLLDLASVGTAAGPATADACKRIRQRAPSLEILSGGGIRSAGDVRQLIGSGCDRCLIATALHPASSS